MSIIQVTDLTFGYDGSYDLVFEHVNLQLDTDWRLGFTGRNGRGKTTFLRLLMGELAYSGSIQASVEFGYFPFPVPDPDQDTLAVMGLACPAAQDWEMIREASLLDVDTEALYRPFSTLSQGERTKVLLAAMFLEPGRFLLIDEPTNHLDAAARARVGAYLRTKKGFILVSHDRTLLDESVDHILAINRSDIQVQQGNFSSWWENKQRQDEYELAENARLKREIGRLNQAARQASDWSDRVEKTKNGTRISGVKADKGYVSHKSAKMMQRAKNQQTRMERAAEDRSRLLKNVESADRLKLSPLPYPKDLLLEAEDLRLYYGDAPVCGPLGFRLRRGQRLAVTGRNGSGKSTLLKLICGQEVRHTGRLDLGSNLRISWVAQDTAGLRGSLTDYARNWGIDESRFKTILRKLDFSRTQFDKDMAEFSAGQRKKVLLARSLCQSAHLYVWDEPLNYIDVLSRMQLEELLLDCQPTMLFVEHDAAFVQKIATGTIDLDP